MNKKKGKPGRKELPPGMARNIRKEVSFRQSELDALTEEADRRFIPVAQLIRELTLDGLARITRQ